MIPIISVIIPSYNHAGYIEAAVRSVLQQSLRNLELIVIDDGSKDNSRELLARFSDPRMQVLWQENSGAHATINRGLKLARGKYLAILNSDDEFMPERLDEAVKVLERDPGLGFVSSWIEVVDGEGATLGVKQGWENMLPWPVSPLGEGLKRLSEFNLNLIASNFISTTSNIVMRRELFEEVGEFRNLRFAHDWDFCLRAVALSNASIIPKALMKYRVHGSNTIRQDQTGMIFEICWVLAANLPAFHDRISQLASPAQMVELLEWLSNALWTFDNDRVLTMLSLLAKPCDEHGKGSLIELLELDNPFRLFFLDRIRGKSIDNPQVTKPESKMLRAARQIFSRKVR